MKYKIQIYIPAGNYLTGNYWHTILIVNADEADAWLDLKTQDFPHRTFRKESL